MNREERNLLCIALVVFPCVVLFILYLASLGHK